MADERGPRRKPRARRKFRTYHAGPKRTSAEGPAAVDRRAADDLLPLNAHVAVTEVDDPYGEPGAQQRIRVVQSLRTDPLAWMRAHHRIDEARYRAGRSWQQVYARANIGNIGSIDTTREAVSGGRFPEAITDGRIDAFKKLREADEALGSPELSGLVFDILGRELFPSQVAEEHGDYTDWGKRKWARKFYKSLDLLAVHFKFGEPKPLSRKTSPKRPQST